MFHASITNKSPVSFSFLVFLALGNSEPFDGLQDIDEKIDACRKLYKLYGSLNQDIFVQGEPGKNAVK